MGDRAVNLPLYRVGSRAAVQENGCWALGTLCAGDGAEAAAARERAVAAGALRAVVAALEAHRDETGVQHRGCLALQRVCDGDDDGAGPRAQAACAAGAAEAVVAALEALGARSVAVADQGCAALCSICFGDDAGVDARCARVEAAGAVAVVVAAMCAHPSSGGVQGNGCAALANVCAGCETASGKNLHFPRRNRDLGRFPVDIGWCWVTTRLSLHDFLGSAENVFLLSQLCS